MEATLVPMPRNRYREDEHPDVVGRRTLGRTSEASKCPARTAQSQSTPEFKDPGKAPVPPSLYAEEIEIDGACNIGVANAFSH